MGKKRRTTQEFKDYICEKTNGKVEILSEYNGACEPIDFVYHCEIHGDIYKTMNAKNISSNKEFQPCDECTREKQRMNSGVSRKPNDLYNEFKKHIENKGGTLITDKWLKSKGKYEIDCGNEDHPNFITTHDKIMHSNQWCPYCCGRKGEFDKYYSDLIESKNGEMLSDYIGSYNHLKVRCKTHNYIWEIMPLNLKKGRWCPICNLPNSEIAIYDLLIKCGYDFSIQYTFNDFKNDNGNEYKFDFAIFDNTGRLLLLIESDGANHRENRKPNDYHYNTYLSDCAKEEYCDKNSIKLVRIDYVSKWSYKYHYEYAKNILIPIIEEELKRR